MVPALTGCHGYQASTTQIWAAGSQAKLPPSPPPPGTGGCFWVILTEFASCVKHREVLRSCVELRGLYPELRGNHCPRNLGVPPRPEPLTPTVPLQVTVCCSCPSSLVHSIPPWSCAKRYVFVPAEVAVGSPVWYRMNRARGSLLRAHMLPFLSRVSLGAELLGHPAGMTSGVSRSSQSFSKREAHAPTSNRARPCQCLILASLVGESKRTF